MRRLVDVEQELQMAPWQNVCLGFPFCLKHITRHIFHQIENTFYICHWLSGWAGETLTVLFLIFWYCFWCFLACDNLMIMVIFTFLFLNNFLLSINNSHQNCIKKSAWLPSGVEYFVYFIISAASALVSQIWYFCVFNHLLQQRWIQLFLQAPINAFINHCLRK